MACPKCPIGAYNPQIGPPLILVTEAVSHILNRLNSQPSPPDPHLTTKERNIIICARHAAGVSQAELARQFGISYQRVHQIVQGKRK
jgi:ribosome-binding protein aMBF1 (putative translation factor)